MMIFSLYYYPKNPPNLPTTEINTICHTTEALNVTNFPPDVSPVKTPDTELWETLRFLRTTPRTRFQGQLNPSIAYSTLLFMSLKENLRKDAFYITSWANAGFTPSAGPLPFGEIFDLKGLRESLRKPVLEWSDVKSLPPRLSLEAPSYIEQIGCWSTRPPNQKEPILAHNLLHHLGLDVSYTRLPEHVRQDPSLAAHGHIGLMPVAEKIYPLNPLTHNGDQILMAPSPNGAKLSPGNHLACFDFLYFASAGTQPYEWNTPWSPAWRLIGTHIRFTDTVLELTKKYVRRALRVTARELPPFITVHARRGDFVHQCFDVPSQCLAPISAYARRVKEIQGAIFVKFGIKVTEVLITSDETDPAFWKEVKDEGWRYIDHDAQRISEQYGEWYDAIIDIVAQSLGIGFVGSVDSTVSIVSAHRVEDWNQGVTRMVNWGGRD
ncbi:hypothetical protein H0H92_007923 [Tricholoma furcatifolium]|nr:hypothetical protein H0H92_007923 [Tricholoma furcatifolium]